MARSLRTALHIFASGWSEKKTDGNSNVPVKSALVYKQRSRTAISSAGRNTRATGSVEAWSEEELLAASKGGQTNAFGELCERHAKKIFGVTRMRNREDAEDALQDSFLRVFFHIRDFDGRSGFSAWLTHIAIKPALMILRKKRAYRDLSLDGLGDVGAKGRHWEAAGRARNPEEAMTLHKEVANTSFFNELISKRRKSCLNPMLARSAVKRDC